VIDWWLRSLAQAPTKHYLERYQISYGDSDEALYYPDRVSFHILRDHAGDRTRNSMPLT